ncbi:MAG: hypothetical protein AABZ02_08455 [Bacteroidota bacterium]|jgi:uncharacterized membrane protein YeaQ/YmgE (transglycosylase-associated protein family)
MNWKLISLLSLFSIAMGSASVLGLTQNYEWLMWLVIGVLCAWIFARRVADDFFLHGFYLGILDGVFNALIQAMFFSTYLANNPKMVEGLKDMPQAIPPAVIVLIMGPIIGALSGVVFGLLTVIAGKLVKKPPVESPPT